MEVQAEVASQALDYTKNKLKAVSSEARRVIIPASNGNSFQCGQTIEVSIGGNQDRTFMDWQSSYLKFTVTNNDGAAIKFGGKAGAYNLIEKMEVLSGGQTLSTIDNYNVLINMLADLELSAEYKENNGKLLADMDSAFAAPEIAAGDSRTYCLPLLACPFYNSSKYFPLFSRDVIKIRLTLSSAARATIGAAVDTEVVLSPVELVCTNIQLNEDAFAMLLQQNMGFFNIVTHDYRNAVSSIAVGDRTMNANLGFSFISLDRVLFSFLGTTNTALADSNGNRSRRSLTEYNVSVNGKSVPARKIQVSATNLSEPLAELLNSSKALPDINMVGNLDRNDTYGTSDGAGTAVGTVGSFLAGIDLESMREHGSGESLYSGMGTLGAVVQLEGTMNADGGAINQLHTFAQFTSSYTLDMDGSQTWDYIA